MPKLPTCNYFLEYQVVRARHRLNSYHFNLLLKLQVMGVKHMPKTPDHLQLLCKLLSDGG